MRVCALRRLEGICVPLSRKTHAPHDVCFNNILKLSMYRKRDAAGKIPPRPASFFRFPDFRLCCRAPSLSRTAARRLILPSLLLSRLRQEAQLLCADAFLCRKNAVADCAGIHPPPFAHAAARMSEMRQTILIFGEKYYTFLSKREYPGFSEVPYCRLKFSSFFFM